MAYENLLKSVEESAHERELELREKAQNTVLELKAEALKKAETIRSELLDDAIRSATVERNKLMYLTKAESRERLITTRGEIYSQAFASAKQRLAQLRNDPGYPEIFKNLAIEAIGSASLERCTIHIDKLDEKLCKKIMTALNQSCEIVPDLQTMGGLVVNSSDGLITFSNTVESRLERGKERLRLEIYSVLLGG